MGAPVLGRWREGRTGKVRQGLRSSWPRRAPGCRHCSGPAGWTPESAAPPSCLASAAPCTDLKGKRQLAPEACLTSALEPPGCLEREFL